MARVRGVRELVARRYGAGGSRLIRNIGRTLFVGGERIQVEAQRSITDGAVSGAAHIPSRPPEPPNNDTGVLANNIETVQTGPLRVEVQSNAPYSVDLEYGTSTMPARPFMSRAVVLKRREVQDLIRQAKEASMRGA